MGWLFIESILDANTNTCEEKLSRYIPLTLTIIRVQELAEEEVEVEEISFQHEVATAQPAVPKLWEVYQNSSTDVASLAPIIQANYSELLIIF